MVKNDTASICEQYKDCVLHVRKRQSGNEVQHLFNIEYNISENGVGETLQ